MAAGLSNQAIAEQAMILKPKVLRFQNACLLEQGFTPQLCGSLF
jgi:hypothetical protein